MKKILLAGLALGMLSLFAVSTVAHERPDVVKHDSKVEFKSDVVNQIVVPYSAMHYDYAADLPVAMAVTNSTEDCPITSGDATALVNTFSDVQPHCHGPTGINI